MLAGTNNLFKFNKSDLTLRLNINYLNERNRENASSTTTYYLADDTIIQDERKSGVFDAHKLYATANLILNSKKRYLENEFSSYINKNKDVGNFYLNNKLSLPNLKANQFNFSNNFKSIHLSGKNFYTFNSKIRLANDNQQLTIYPGVNSPLLNSGLPYKAATQKKELPDFNTENTVAFSRKTYNIYQNYVVGFSYQRQKLQTDLHTLSDLNNINTKESSFINDLLWQKFNVYIEPNFRYLIDRGEFVLRAPIHAINLRYNDDFNLLDEGLTGLSLIQTSPTDKQ